MEERQRTCLTICKRLFQNDSIEPDIFMNTLVGAVEEAQPAEISELTAIMDRQQLEASFQHLVRKWKELKESISLESQPCRPSTSDSQLLQPATGTYTRITPTSPIRAKRLLPNVPMGTTGCTSPPADRGTLDNKSDIPTLTLQKHTPKPPRQ